MDLKVWDKDNEKFMDSPIIIWEEGSVHVFRSWMDVNNYKPVKNVEVRVSL